MSVETETYKNIMPLYFPTEEVEVETEDSKEPSLLLFYRTLKGIF